MMSDLRFIPVEQAGYDLAPLWKSISKWWTLRGGTTDIIPSLEERIATHIEGKLTGVLAYYRDVPVAVGWVEKSSPTYGNMVVHAIAPQFRNIIPDYIVKQGLIDKVFAELVTFEDTLEYRKAFLRLGARENARQRMGVDISEFTPVICTIPGITFDLLTLADSPITAKISAHAHRFSKDYQGFWDLESTPHRMAMDERLFSDFYGKFIHGAALKMMFNGEIIGSTASVEGQCWGYDKVPWVFDITVDGRFRGQGLGRALFVELMSRLRNLGYEVMGLAVTMSNTAAVRLYESLGFTITDAFFEYTTNLEVEPNYDD